MLIWLRRAAAQADTTTIIGLIRPWFFFGAHYWQRREKEKLTMRYLLDMQKLTGDLKAGTAKEERVTFGPYLNRNFISGEAIITWNKADAERFKAE